MNRLTECARNRDGKPFYRFSAESGIDIRCRYCVGIERAIDKLGAYEDTGLEPEDIRTLQEEHDFYSKEDAPASKRLIELALAAKEGRCVVLPCKIGDTVMLDAEILGCSLGSMPYTVKGISIELVADWASATQHRTVSLETIKVALSQKGADHK